MWSESPFFRLFFFPFLVNLICQLKVVTAVASLIPIPPPKRLCLLVWIFFSWARGHRKSNSETPRSNLASRRNWLWNFWLSSDFFFFFFGLYNQAYRRFHRNYFSTKDDLQKWRLYLDIRVDCWIRIRLFILDSELKRLAGSSSSEIEVWGRTEYIRATCKSQKRRNICWR